MIVDSSALIAILNVERDAPAMTIAMQEAPALRIAAPTVLEASIVVRRDRWARLDEILAEIEVVPFDREQALAAREAHATYGRGSGSRARLNLGDCFSYALAKVTGEPLLFKGDDFNHTDITPALTRD